MRADKVSGQALSASGVSVSGLAGLVSGKGPSFVGFGGRTKCPDSADKVSGGQRTPLRDGVSVRPVTGVLSALSATVRKRREGEDLR